MTTEFSDSVRNRWLESQPDDIQDFLQSHAEIEHLGQQISLVFPTMESAKAAQCLADRFVQPNGLPALFVKFRYGQQRASLPSR